MENEQKAPGFALIFRKRTLQKPLSGTTYPQSGEIDLMKYLDDKFRPKDFFDRVIAAEDDVKSLLWLARVNFNE